MNCHEFIDVVSKSSNLKLAIMALGFKYDNLNVTCKKRHKTRGEILWHVSCPQQKDGCKFVIKISHKANQQWPTVFEESTEHNHTIDTPESVQEISGSKEKLVFVADLLEFEDQIKEKLKINIAHNLELSPLHQWMRAELFGANTAFDDQCEYWQYTVQHTALRVHSTLYYPTQYTVHSTGSTQCSSQHWQYTVQHTALAVHSTVHSTQHWQYTVHSYYNTHSTCRNESTSLNV